MSSNSPNAELYLITNTFLLAGNVGIPPSEFRPGFSYREPLDKSSRYMTELDLYRVEVPEDRQRKVYTRLVDATFEVNKANPYVPII